MSSGTQRPAGENYPEVWDCCWTAFLLISLATSIFVAAAIFALTEASR